jgi:hypothetical protein
MDIILLALGLLIVAAALYIISWVYKVLNAIVITISKITTGR